MTVADLIRHLKKTPQHLEVGYAHGDNDEHEIAGWVNRVHHMSKSDYRGLGDTNMVNSQPDEWVKLS